MPEAPELARLERLTTDELVLVAYYRACTPEIREAMQDFARVSAELCKQDRGANVHIIFPWMKKQ
jgi:hypothetical protein